jgi:hypothetical protein
MNPKGVILGSWGVAGAIITVQWVIGSQPGFPPPGRYLASGVVFSMLFIASAAVPELAAVIAAGTAFAMLLQPYLKGKPGVLDQSAAWIGKLSGQPKPG